MYLLGFTEPLWGVRYRPLVDELLSSWLVRLAHGHGLKIQTFCNLLFGQRLQVWNRDIDRLAPPWLLDVLIARTGTTRDKALASTLRVFEGVLFPVAKESGNLTWVAPVQIYHRIRHGTGMHFCPACLASAPVAYFRKTWRLALKTMCVQHQCMLQSRCPRCELPVSFFRMDMGRPEVPEVGALARCWCCGFDLASAPAHPIVSLTAESDAWLQDVIRQVDAASEQQPHDLDDGRLAVLRQLMRLMVSDRPHVRVLPYLLEKLDMPDPLANPVAQRHRRIPFESLPLDVRHQLLSMGAWVLSDPHTRLVELWRNEALRYNHFVREFDAAPAWYLQTVESLRLGGKFQRKPLRSSWREKASNVSTEKSKAAGRRERQNGKR